MPPRCTEQSVLTASRPRNQIYRLSIDVFCGYRGADDHRLALSPAAEAHESIPEYSPPDPELRHRRLDDLSGS